MKLMTPHWSGPGGSRNGENTFVTPAITYAPILGQAKAKKERKITSLANLVTHQAQRHSQSLVCFVRTYALALVRADRRTDGHHHQN